MRDTDQMRQVCNYPIKLTEFREQIGTQFSVKVTAEQPIKWLKIEDNIYWQDFD
jgi:hypothetical protein